MKCPVCKEANLVMSERQGIEIDYCQQCRGIWLDRGELDKIIERSAGQGGGRSEGDRPRDHDRDSSDRRHEDDRRREEYRRPDDSRKYDEHRKHEDEYSKKKKRGSFLEDLFDFG